MTMSTELNCICPVSRYCPVAKQGSISKWIKHFACKCQTCFYCNFCIHCLEDFPTQYDLDLHTAKAHNLRVCPFCEDLITVTDKIDPNLDRTMYFRCNKCNYSWQRRVDHGCQEPRRKQPKNVDLQSLAKKAVCKNISSRLNIKKLNLPKTLKIELLDETFTVAGFIGAQNA